jgi:hypothetical protein
VPAARDRPHRQHAAVEVEADRRRQRRPQPEAHPAGLQLGAERHLLFAADGAAGHGCQRW